MSVELLHQLFSELGLEKNKLFLSIANNHILDWGKRGLENTINRLDSMGIRVLGLQNRILDPSHTICLDNQQKIRLASWTQWVNNSFEENNKPFRHEISGIEQIMKAMRSRPDDKFILLPHWDYEYQHFPSSETVMLAHSMPENCRLIVGTHSHTIQPLQQIKNFHCLYSIGNLLNPATPLSLSLSSSLGFLFEVHISSNGLSYYCCHPTVHDYKNNQLRLVSKQDEGCLNILRRLYAET